MEKIKKIILILLTFVLVSQPILSVLFISTSAAESEGDIKYTNAYNDLIENRNFNPDEYPKLDKSNPNYYSLEVITIAESVNGELFVYVYQPSANADLKASHITLARSDRNANVDDLEGFGKFEVYSLTYLNNYNQFFKYKVDELQVSSDSTRYYEITDILRPFNKDYGDLEPGGDNTVSVVPYAVGKNYTFTGALGEDSLLSVRDVEYITVTNKFVGYIEVEQDLWVNDSSIHLHFLAFSTDFPIEKLIDATVYYETQNYSEGYANFGRYEKWGEIESHYITLDDKSTIEFEVSDGFVHKESFELIDQILPTHEFLNQHISVSLFPGFSTSDKIEFTEEAKSEILKTDWVLTFAKTFESFTTATNGDTHYKDTRVGNVKLLRLKFKTDDKIYDLGVVDNMQTGSNNPSAVVEEQEWFQKLVLLMIVIICMLAVYIFLDIYVPWLAKIIRWIAGAFWWLFKSLVKLITWPFRALFSDVKRTVKRKLKIKGRRGRPKGKRGRPPKKKETRNRRLLKEAFDGLKNKASKTSGNIEPKDKNDKDG